MKKIVLSLALVASVALVSAVYADEPPPPAPTQAAPKPDPKPDKEGFVPVAPNELLAPGEILPASRLVGIAYGVILAAIVIWVGSVAARSRKVEEELATLRAQLNKQPNKHTDKQSA